MSNPKPSTNSFKVPITAVPILKEDSDFFLWSSSLCAIIRNLNDGEAVSKHLKSVIEDARAASAPIAGDLDAVLGDNKSTSRVSASKKPKFNPESDAMRFLGNVLTMRISDDVFTSIMCFSPHFEEPLDLFSRLCSKKLTLRLDDQVHLQSEWSNFCMHKGESVSDFRMRLFKLVRKMRSFNPTFPTDTHIALTLISALPDKHRQMKESLSINLTLCRKLDIDVIDSVFKALLRCESSPDPATAKSSHALNNLGGGADTDRKMPVGKKKPRSSLKCTYCRKSGHTRDTCRARLKLCFACGSKDHQLQACPTSKKKTGGTSSYPRSQGTSGKPDKGRDPPVDDFKGDDSMFSLNMFTEVINHVLDSQHASHSVVIDSGASTHAFRPDCPIIRLKNRRDEQTRLKLPNGTFVTATSRADVWIGSFVFQNACISDQLSSSFVSVGCLAREVSGVTFTATRCVLGRNKKTLIFRYTRGLYILDPPHDLQFERAPDHVNALDQSEAALQEHAAMGHPFARNLACPTCMICKPIQLPHPSLSECKFAPGEFLMYDLMGPVVSSYLLLAVDRASRCLHYAIVDRKSDAAPALVRIVRYIHAQTSVRLKAVQSDSGGEWRSTALVEWLERRGVTVRYAPARQHQSQGLVERANRTVTDVTRCLLYHARLSPSSWSYAVAHAIYLLNRRTHKSTSRVPLLHLFPHEKILPQLRVFGEDCVVLRDPIDAKSDPAQRFAPKGQPAIFLGYSGPHFRVKNLCTHRTYVSPDVTFGQGPSTFALGPRVQSLLPSPPARAEGPVNVPNLALPVPQPNDRHIDVDVSELKNAEDDSDDPDPSPRRSGRRVQFNSRYADYVFQLGDSPCAGDLFETLSNVSVAAAKTDPAWEPAFAAELENISQNKVLRRLSWEEYHALKANDVPVVQGHWVLRVKSDGTKKARIVAGDTRRFVPLHEKTSPVISYPGVRMVLSHAMQLDKPLHQLDVSAAYLNASIDVDIILMVDGVPHLLLKALYGIQQAGLLWFKHLSSALSDAGFTPVYHEKCLFYDNQGNLLAVYVDDLVASCSDDQWRVIIKSLHKYCSRVKDVSSTTSYRLLGLLVQRGPTQLKVSCGEYIERLCVKHLSPASREVRVTHPFHLLLESLRPLDPDQSAQDPYRSLIGALLFIAGTCRPDVAFVVNYLARFTTSCTDDHLACARHVLAYLFTTRASGLVYRRHKCDVLHGYVDASFASPIHPRGKSTTGFCLYFYGNLVYWRSARQTIFAQSSTEAEFVAASECVRVLLYLRHVASAFLAVPTPMSLACDNEAVIKLSKMSTVTPRTRHLTVRQFLVRDTQASGTIAIRWVPTQKQIADTLTKILAPVTFRNQAVVLLSPVVIETTCHK